MLTIVRKRPEYRCGLEYNGKPLVLIPASKKNFELIMDITEDYREKSGEEQLSLAYRLLALILSSNTDGVTIGEVEAEGIDAMTASEIIREYVDFMRGVKRDPN